MSSKQSVLWILTGLGTLAIFSSAPGQAQSRSAALEASGGAPHVFGTIALPLKRTRFDDRWRRVLRSPTTVGQLTSLVRTARQSPRMEQLRLVNASLNRRIHYRHDAHPSGDHWSTAGETLGRSAGDCEDYAIAKFHALKALGVPGSDLFMTIGHDGAAGAIHAVLVARAKGQFFILDNRTNDLIPHEKYRGFYPIITFGAGSSWLHGYELGKMPTAVRMMNIALQSGRDLPVGSSRGSAAFRPAGP